MKRAPLPDSLPVIRAVALGASAGGVEALGTLLKALPTPFAPSVLVVLHVPPDRPSLLVDLFRPACRIPVQEALDKERIEPGHVYVAPPNYHLLVERGFTVALSGDPPVRFSRPSIDVMFESAAEAFGAELLAIVLSGANDDGAQGLAAVRRAGGRAWVQDPATAQSPTMPAAALKRAGADLVLSLQDMAQRLVNLRSGRMLPT